MCVAAAQAWSVRVSPVIPFHSDSMREFGYTRAARSPFAHSDLLPLSKRNSACTYSADGASHDIVAHSNEIEHEHEREEERGTGRGEDDLGR